MDEALRQMIGADFATARSSGLVKASDIKRVGEAVSSTMHLREAWILDVGRKSGEGEMRPEVGSAMVLVFDWNGKSWSLVTLWQNQCFQRYPQPAAEA